MTDQKPITLEIELTVGGRRFDFAQGDLKWGETNGGVWVRSYKDDRVNIPNNLKKSEFFPWTSIVSRTLIYE